nr:MAG TPA: hypothetical protein [Caudoviricetes sp.]
MNLFSWIKEKKNIKELWNSIQPLLVNVAEKNIPKYISNLDKNLEKYTQPAIDVLFKLKDNTKTSPSSLDDFFFKQGVNILESFANHLLGVVAELRE